MKTGPDYWPNTRMRYNSHSTVLALNFSDPCELDKLLVPLRHLQATAAPFLVAEQLAADATAAAGYPDAAAAMLAMGLPPPPLTSHHHPSARYSPRFHATEFKEEEMVYSTPSLPYLAPPFSLRYNDSSAAYGELLLAEDRARSANSRATAAAKKVAHLTNEVTTLRSQLKVAQKKTSSLRMALRKYRLQSNADRSRLAAEVAKKERRAMKERKDDALFLPKEGEKEVTQDPSVNTLDYYLSMLDGKEEKEDTVVGKADGMEDTVNSDSTSFSNGQQLSADCTDSEAADPTDVSMGREDESVQQSATIDGFHSLLDSTVVVSRGNGGEGEMVEIHQQLANDTVVDGALIIPLPATNCAEFQIDFDRLKCNSEAIGEYFLSFDPPSLLSIFSDRINVYHARAIFEGVTIVAKQEMHDLFHLSLIACSLHSLCLLPNFETVALFLKEDDKANALWLMNLFPYSLEIKQIRKYFM